MNRFLAVLFAWGCLVACGSSGLKALETTAQSDVENEESGTEAAVR